MTAVPELRSQRLLLRAWREQDLDPWAALNGDPGTMHFMGGVLDRVASDALAARIRAKFGEQGLALWAVELPATAPFIGFIGLAAPGFVARFTPCVEVGWRLARAHWGRGYATEGARVVLDFAFDRLGLSEVVSFTAAGNLRSRRVMERLGMTHAESDDFDHPKLPDGDSLRRHVLYRLRREQWRSAE